MLKNITRPFTTQKRPVYDCIVVLFMYQNRWFGGKKELICLIFETLKQMNVNIMS